MIRIISYLSLIIGFAGVLISALLSLTIAPLLISILLLALGIALLIAGIAKMSLSFFLKCICATPQNEPFVSLTFDDGPSENTGRLLDILDMFNAKATFFCTGRKSEQYPSELKRILESGHTIGSHTYSHNVSFTYSGLRDVLFEIERGADTIAKMTGNRPLLFRPPFGVTNPVIAKGIKTAGLINVGWSIRSFDTMTNDAGKILSRILPKLKAGSIVLLHDNVKATAEALPAIIDEIYKHDLKPVDLEQALKIKAYEDSGFYAGSNTAPDSE